MDEISFEDKFQKIREIYDQLNTMIKGNGINLVDDQNLNTLILDLCRKFELKMNSKLSYGIVFDSRYNDECLIDALVNERIGSMLNPKFPYMLQGDASRREIKIDSQVNDIKTISVPVNKWESFANSVMLLSPENFKDFMEKIKLDNTYDPDVLILVLKSIEELQNAKIQSFLSSLGQHYNDGNFLLVLNDVPQIDCIAYDYCDVCYPENLRLFLNETQLKLEDRIFRISAQKHLKFRDYRGELSDEDQNLQENFKIFKDTLDHELDMNCIIDRFYKNAQIIGEYMNAIQKTFDEKKLKEIIIECEIKFKEKSPEVIEDIQKHEDTSLKDASRLINDKNNRQDDFLRNVLKNFMKKKCGSFRNEFEEKILEMIKDLKEKNYNKELGNMTKNMFFNEYLNEKSFENKIDDFIYPDIDRYKIKDLKKENVDFSKFNMDNIDLEKFQNENSESQTVSFKFLKSSKNMIVKIFKIAKESFTKFTESFKEEAVKVVEEVKQTIDYTVKIAKELHLRHMVSECRKMKLLVEDKRKSIRNQINTHVDMMNEKLIEMDYEDVKNDNFGNLITDLMESFAKVWDIKSIRDELYNQLHETGSSELSQNITDHFAEEYRNKYLLYADVDKFEVQMKDKIDKLNKKINDKKFYINDEEEVIDFNNENPMTAEEIIIQKKPKRSIKTTEILKQILTSTNDMYQSLNDITIKLNEGIDKFIVYMKNYSF